jgi:2-dehydropantoate 2-reductase
VTIQNGLEILSIAKKHTDTKMLCGAVGYNAVHEEFGIISVTSRGGITFCTLNGAVEDDLFMMRGILSPMIPFHSLGDTEAVLWTKLLIVCGATGLGGVAGLRVGKLLRHRKARKLFYAMATEGSLLAEKLGIRLLKLPGAINPEKFGNHRGGVPLPLRRFLLLVAGITFAQLKSNIHVDLERGNKTEIDYINGAVVSEGERIGFDTPVNRLVVNMVKEIEDGHRTMCSENLSEMWNMVKDSPLNNIRDID